MVAAADPHGPALRALEMELRAAVRDLVQAPITPWWGALRLVLFGSGLLGGSWLFWTSPHALSAALALLLAGIAYALLLITTHDAVHGTLLGRPRLEFALACLISWPMAWPFATYACLHRLHHRWNGCDPRDPERVEPLAAEPGGGLWRWHRRHPLWGRALLLGGLGLIAETAWRGWCLRGVDRRLTRRLRLDLTGALMLHAAMLVAALLAGRPLRYLLFWLVLERIIGAIVQTRGLIEHYGLWRPSSGHLLTQLRSSQTVTTTAWLNVCMGGLPHHAAHHAFPSIPFQSLPEASRRINAVLRRHQLVPLPQLTSYGDGVRRLI
jgi:fatty acid desaturase